MAPKLAQKKVVPRAVAVDPDESGKTAATIVTINGNIFL